MFRGLAGELVVVHAGCVDGCAGSEWLIRCGWQFHAKLVFTAFGLSSGHERRVKRLASLH